MSDTTKPVWFITGCSTGFGRELAHHTLSPRLSRRRHRPQSGTGRRVRHGGRAALRPRLAARRHRARRTSPPRSTAAEADFGRIDVLVNNAGIGYFGSFEESEIAEVRNMFEINVWGLTHMTRAVLPGMRSAALAAPSSTSPRSAACAPSRR